ncbi:MAG: hypothetical protein FJ095_21605 [Deltaproteobacteria bacterium]|nr:hypothetical protein [Deltaproteobacteria bacterium]
MADPQPEPAPGGGVWEPPTTTLDDYRCAGLDWQILNHFIVIAHRAPELGDPASIKRCEQRFAGWVTTAADAGNDSRASVYAALEASGACDESPTYPGLVLAPSLCTKPRPDLGADVCAEKLASEPAFGILLTADVLANATMRKAHLRGPVRMGALLGHASVACGGDDRWKLLAPEQAASPSSRSDQKA